MKTPAFTQDVPASFAAAHGSPSLELEPAVASGESPGAERSGRSLLDLFCGEGGAGEGYRLAGFDVTGVDIAPQRKNPHRFVLADALEYLREHGHKYDAIHASPPCQAYTSARRIQNRTHPELVAPVREALEQIGVPWVIENVEGAPLRNPVMLCGSMFGLPVRRHRLFEASFPLPESPAKCDHTNPAVTIIGHGVYPSSLGVRHKGTASLGYQAGRDAMQIPWMSWDKLSQAVPPAYTRWIGECFLVRWAAGAGRGAEMRVNGTREKTGNKALSESARDERKM